jgi:hypothetical protein
MKRYAILVFLFVVIFSKPQSTYANNYSGQWLAVVTESLNHCKSLGKAEPGKYKLTIIHKNNDITIMENVVQRPYTGVVNPKRPLVVHVQGNYVDDGGYVSELINIEFKNDSGGKGQSVWSWSDGYLACGGRFSFTLEKIRP